MELEEEIMQFVLEMWKWNAYMNSSEVTQREMKTHGSGSQKIDQG
jgi:hypothetical protein